MLTGSAGAPGTAEGTARVILDVRQIGELQDGEILVAPVTVTSPSWTPVFGKVAAATPLGRVGEPADLLGALAFLLSDESAFVTGQTLLVNGGRVLR